MPADGTPAPEREPGVGPRIAVVDDDTVIRMGTPLLLTRVTTVATYADITALMAEHPSVDVVLLDLNLAGTGAVGVLHGAAGIRSVAARHPVLIYTNERRRDVLAGCLAAGASGVVHKAESVDSLHAAICAVAAGQVVVTPALTGLAELVERQGELPTLTRRQREVLSGRARGEPFQALASRLDISRRTAEEHMAAVTAKFAEYLRSHSPADLERRLGIGEHDLLR